MKRTFNPEDLKRIPITELVPQRAPMLMVDTLYAFTEDECSTLTAIRSDNVFIENGVLSVPGLIENMAQTCAARLGFADRFINGNSISIGYIGAVKNLNIVRQPKIGETIETTIVTVTEAFGMTLVDAITKVDGQEIASCQLKIALAENR